eukprot:2736474-Heterocapsa_arctica.AAC.1
MPYMWCQQVLPQRSSPGGSACPRRLVRCLIGCRTTRRAATGRTAPSTAIAHARQGPGRRHQGTRDPLP